MTILVKDFIETKEGLRFAVVASGTEAGKVRCFLRYIYQSGSWRKVDTEAANHYLQESYPQYLFYSPQMDARLHAVDESDISQHYSPKITLTQILARETTDPVLADCKILCGLFADVDIDMSQLGITGSILLGLQNNHSDIDLVCYDRKLFQQLRSLLAILIEQQQCRQLNDGEWLASYQRRACDLSLADYIWHEQRKFNKAIINQRKFDLSLVSDSGLSCQRTFKKLGFVCIEAVVISAELAFDYPAEFTIDDAEIAKVVSFTATYTGQAWAGERIRVAGQLEADELGHKRIVVGSNREAAGEYIKVLRCEQD